MRETLSVEEIEIRAVTFSKQHAEDKSEESQKHDFIRDFLKVFGQTENVGEFEKHVKTTQNELKKIDFYWKDHIAIEMKSRGKSLENAFYQLNKYMECLEPYEVPNIWMVCDFENIHLYRRDTNQTMTFKTARLRKYIPNLVILAGHRMDRKWALAHTWLLPPYEPTTECLEKPPVDIHATAKMTKLYSAMKATNYKERHIQVYLARLLFCFFADDTGIFPQDTFYHYVNDPTMGYKGLSGRLAELFEDLNKPIEERVTRHFVNNTIKRTDFRYINGKLFEEKLDHPSFDENMFQILRDCINFDWSKINPAIFGSLFQGIMDKKERRETGSHYTSEENILKLVNPLLMDDLRGEFEKAKRSPIKTALSTFHHKLANLKFLDPACGCGNFLIIAYRELRRLEHKVVMEQFGHYKKMDNTPLDLKAHLAVRVEQFHGIEINPWPCQLAKTGMWLMDHLMNMEVSEEFGQPHARLPLENGANIVQGNALKMDWADVVPKKELDYIFGNPQFAGKKEQTAEQKAELVSVFGNMKGCGNLDYVTAWFQKAAEMASGTSIRTAFVSTNSIAQGQQPPVLWKSLDPLVKIDFAYKTFKWTNEAAGKAAVHCVIIGFSPHTVETRCVIYDGDSKTIAGHINSYLADEPSMSIASRTKPLCTAPKMFYGSMPIDNGALILSAEDRNEMEKSEPQSLKFVRRYMGGEELVNNTVRYCLWLKDHMPSEYTASKFIKERIRLCRQFRESSDREQTRRLADTPQLFGEIRQPETDMLVIPKVSSENRKYLPMAFLPPETIVSGSALIIPDATLYHFGVLTSCVHNAWMRAVCGRMKSDFQYSKSIVYNTFPWPDATEKQMAEIAGLAQRVLAARAEFPNRTLADLYSQQGMQPELIRAHRELDRAVMNLYGFIKDTSEPAMVAALAKRHDEMARQEKAEKSKKQSVRPNE